MKSLETERLLLRPFRLSDAPAVYDYAKLDSVGPKAGWKPHENLGESKKIVEHFIEKQEVYAIVYKKVNKVIGSIGIHKTKLGSIGDVYELGFVLHPEYHRRGLMSEAVYACLDECFFECDYPEIYVGHFIENQPSRALIEKFGFQWVEDIAYSSRDYGLKESKIYKYTKLNYILKRRNER